MAIIVEDGSIVAGANSYISRADYITAAAAVGVTVTSDTTADSELIKAAAYIDAHEINLQGYKTARDNPMAFPRTNVNTASWQWTSSEIPTEVIKAQIEYALDIHAGKDLWNRGGNPNLIASEKRIEGAVSVKLAVNAGNQVSTFTSRGDAFLMRLLKNNGAPIMVRT